MQRKPFRVPGERRHYINKGRVSANDRSRCICSFVESDHFNLLRTGSVPKHEVGWAIISGHILLSSQHLDDILAMEIIQEHYQTSRFHENSATIFLKFAFHGWCPWNLDFCTWPEFRGAVIGTEICHHANSIAVPLSEHRLCKLFAVAILNIMQWTGCVSKLVQLDIVLKKLAVSEVYHWDRYCLTTRDHKVRAALSPTSLSENVMTVVPASICSSTTSSSLTFIQIERNENGHKKTRKPKKT